uniref:uncharacterized protein LOC124059109 n=1 Tax=Scatophagus argus TaxID=75038 RepID=UPI001ED85CFD|nr:uncharacterized protein LOC124059109 [Scatophagus argus]
MASRCSPQYFLNQRRSPLMMALVLIVTGHFLVTESVAVEQFRGEVGGNVTIHCPSVKDKKITFFYFQRDVHYVNGFHTLRDISESTSAWENTRVTPNNTTVHMYNLNISHAGDYECLILYSDSETITKDVIHLNVTANYSVPEVTLQCVDGLSCLVTCASHGGYPSISMTWSVPGSDMWNVVNSSEMPDPNTMLVNSSSTAHFNCSNGELKYISCSVGDVTSPMFSVCENKDPDNADNLLVIVIAIITLVIFTVPTVVFVVCWTHRKGQRGATVDVKQSWRVNGSEEEEVALGEERGENEAP